MRPETNKITVAWQQGNIDKVCKKSYKNPYDKNMEKAKYKAYKNGYESS